VSVSAVQRGNLSPFSIALDQGGGLPKWSATPTFNSQCNLLYRIGLHKICYSYVQLTVTEIESTIIETNFKNFLFPSVNVVVESLVVNANTIDLGGGRGSSWCL